mmetsp:Transcript_121287/g.302684  ORF Transcript_121287/g.302684 Transcript_121287/m.302684 type:complete len:842 (-) Transcript_121287:147-2672(-)
MADEQLPLTAEEAPAAATEVQAALLGGGREVIATAPSTSRSRLIAVAASLVGFVGIAGAAYGASASFLQRGSAASSADLHILRYASEHVPDSKETSTEPLCDESEWHGRGPVCGLCRVLVKSFQGTNSAEEKPQESRKLRKLSGKDGERKNEDHGTCHDYCQSVGHKCKGGWLAPNSGSCAAVWEYELTCAQEMPANNTICLCGERLKHVVNEKHESKEHHKDDAKEEAKESDDTEKEKSHGDAEHGEEKKPKKTHHEKAPPRPKVPTCNPYSDDTDYWTKSMLFTIPHIPSKDMCNKKCNDVVECGAWTWGKARNKPGLTDVCFIKVVDSDGTHTLHLKEGVVSGMRSGKELCSAEESEEYFKAKVAWDKYQASHEGADDSSGHHESAEKEEKADKKQTEEKDEKKDKDEKVKVDEEEDKEDAKAEKRESESKESDEKDNDSQDKGHEDKKLLTHDMEPAHIKSRNGNCLQVADEAVAGAEIQIMTCDATEKRQLWAYEAKTGLLVNQKHGLCLEAIDRAKEYSHLNVQECDADNWNQQWDYFQGPGTIKNWHGICVDGAESYVDGGEVFMRACNEDVDYQKFWYRSLDDMPAEDESTEAGSSLFCFALMLPGSYEQDLLAMQYKNKVSLFDCEGYSVLSNKSIAVAPGLTSGIIDSNLMCKKGGEFGTALNLDIFIAVWKKVISDGTYLHHDWTVKVDPDAVFFADRLRSIVGVHSETPTGVYLNNCKYGLHGPIEVFSRNAITSWAKGRQQCQDYFWKLCHGDCFWGEDLFIDQCLWKVLKVRRDNDWRLLVEDHCSPPKDWDNCEDADRVSFHPFKKADTYMTCLNNANKHSTITFK